MLSNILLGRSNTPKNLHSIALWKNQNQQKHKSQNGGLVAPADQLASTIITGGEVIINPKHLSFLIGGTDKT